MSSGQKGSKVLVVKGKDPTEAIFKGLDRFPMPKSERIVIKPNLVIAEAYPVTTSAETVEAIVKYYKGYKVVVAEGTAYGETWDAFYKLGYSRLVDRYGVELVDLNEDEYELRENPNTFVLSQLDIPRTLENCYLISLASLKKHSLAGITLTLKNMLGIVKPAKGARVRKKSRFHINLHENIVDINIYRKPDLAIIDGRERIDFEIGGPSKELNVFLFSTDPVAVDAIGATLLDYKEPKLIKHLSLAQEKQLGVADLDRIQIEQI